MRLYNAIILLYILTEGNGDFKSVFFLYYIWQSQTVANFLVGTIFAMEYCKVVEVRIETRTIFSIIFRIIPYLALILAGKKSVLWS